MTLDQAIRTGLYLHRHTTAEIRAAYDVLLDAPNYLDRDVLAAKGNIEGFLRRGEAR